MKHSAALSASPPRRELAPGKRRSKRRRGHHGRAPRNVKTERAVKAVSPELHEKARAGKLSVNAAKKQVEALKPRGRPLTNLPTLAN